MLSPPRTGPSRRYISRILTLACVALLLSSCGRESRAPVYPVHGRVLDGSHRPAAGALVVFHPLDQSGPDSPRPLAYVDENGAFALTTYEQGDGAPEGEYVVTIQWRPRSSNPFAAHKQGEDRLHGRYSDPKKSSLRVTIKRQADNALPVIQLR